MLISRIFLFLLLLMPVLLCPVLDAGDKSATAVDDNNAFAVDIFGELCRKEGNLFISPYSISSALAMTYGGAGGETATQMKDVLKLSLPGNEVHRALSDIMQKLGRFGHEGKIRLMIANSIWPQEGYSFYSEFKELLKKYYSVNIFPVNFKDPEKVRRMINDWVSENTNGLIMDMIPPGALDPLTVMVLVNAVYFKASWDAEFDPGRTEKADFHLNSGEAVKADMMNRSGKLRYADYRGCKVLELPYSEREMSMFIVLPSEKGTGILKKPQDLISGDFFRDMEQCMRYCRVDVSIPRFKLAYGVTLNAVLQSMGMTDAYDSNKADFTGMYDKAAAGGENLYISNVRHKAFVEVNEEGTEAAGVTSVEIKRTSAPPPMEKKRFLADRPFIFLIADNSTKSILFMGRIENPNIESSSGD